MRLHLEAAAADDTSDAPSKLLNEGDGTTGRALNAARDTSILVHLAQVRAQRRQSRAELRVRVRGGCRGLGRERRERLKQVRFCRQLQGMEELSCREGRGEFSVADRS